MDNINNLILHLLLGFIQGITEPLPISSSGHMVIFEYFFNIDFSDLNFKIFVNLASFIAIVIFYRKFLKEIIKGFFIYLFKKDISKKQDFLYVIYVFIACIPSAIFGLFFKNIIDNYLSNILTVSLSLFFTSIILFIISNSKNNNNDLNFKNSLIIGSYQIIGLIPGISRSGITTFGGINSKLSIDKALRFSFMMYLPTSLGALILSIPDNNIFINFNYLSLVAFLSSFLGTYIGIHLFLKYINKKTFKYFSLYLFVISVFLFFII